MALNRRGTSSDVKAAATVAFAKALNTNLGKITTAEFDAARNAGLSDGEIVEVIRGCVKVLDRRAVYIMCLLSFLYKYGLCVGPLITLTLSFNNSAEGRSGEVLGIRQSVIRSLASWQR